MKTIFIQEEPFRIPKYVKILLLPINWWLCNSTQPDKYLYRHKATVFGRFTMHINYHIYGIVIIGSTYEIPSIFLANFLKRSFIYFTIGSIRIFQENICAVLERSNVAIFPCLKRVINISISNVQAI